MCFNFPNRPIPVFPSDITHFYTTSQFFHGQRREILSKISEEDPMMSKALRGRSEHFLRRSEDQVIGCVLPKY